MSDSSIGRMENNNFDWYAEVVEVESPIEEETDLGPGLLQSIFEFMNASFRYIGGLLLALIVVRYFLNSKSFAVSGVKIENILLCLVVLTCSFPVTVYIARFCILAFRHMVSEAFERKFSTSYRWFALSIWFAENLYALRFVKKDLKGLHFHTHATLLSGLCISITFSLCNVATEYIHEQFVKRNYYAKMSEVELREKILATMKEYIYEVSESTLSEAFECNCFDMLCLREPPRQSNTLHLNVAQRLGEYCFAKPQFTNVQDVKSLARDVYEKAAGQQVSMVFSEFATIFADAELSVQAYPLFEPDEERRIPRAEFRNAVVSFYYSRVNFDKTLRIARSFTDTIGQIATILASSILILIVLIIFGVPLKELFAVALSSALLLNFMASGMAADMYYNIMLLVSHPFDVGDEVIINDKEYRVHQTGLSNTSFLALNGGKVKMMNSELWKSNLMNMTRAPQKLLVFQFSLPESLNTLKISYLKIRIQQYLRGRPYDFYETYSLEAFSENMIDINTVKCNLVLRARNFQSKSRKFSLRMEINRFLAALLEEISLIDERDNEFGVIS